MRVWLRGCVVGALWFACTGLVAAQGPWIVDGVNGVDAPGRGTTPAAPWKTIGYAMAQATPTVSGANVVFVVGGQVYSPATNGESFPVTMRPGLTLQAFGSGAAPSPVLRVPAGGTGIVFSPNQNYGAFDSAVRGMTVEGGAIGMAMGGDAGFDHDPVVERCEFRQQTVEGVRIRGEGGQVQLPFFRDCLIHMGASGMSTDSILLAGAPRPQLEHCRFRDLTGPGLALLDSSFIYGTRADVSFCVFERVEHGIAMSAGMINASPGTGSIVQHCVFRDIAGSGIRSATASMSGIDLSIDSCMFINCGTGVQLSSLYGDAEMVLRKSTFLSCGIGVTCASQGLLRQFVTASLESNVVRLCGQGVQYFGDGPFSMAGDRIEDCTTGVVVSNPFSPVSLSSCVIVRNGRGLIWYAIGSVDGITFADNLVGALASNSILSGPYSRFIATNSIFAGNGTDLVDQGGFEPILQYVSNSCFQGTSVTGSGNLGLTDPLLSRPTYKLLPGSPCIDRAVSVGTALDFEGDFRNVAGTGTGPALMDMGADEFVPRGSARPYGTGGVGSGLVLPRIGAASVQAPIGSQLSVELTGAIALQTGIAAQSALLTFGWDDASGLLPMDLSPFGLEASLLWNDFVTTFSLQSVSPTGTAAQSLGIPNVAGLVGLTTTYQWFVSMPTGELVGSDGLRVTIGQ